MAIIECDCSDDSLLAVFDTNTMSFIISDNPDYVPPVVILQPVSTLKIWH